MRGTTRWALPCPRARSAPPNAHASVELVRERAAENGSVGAGLEVIEAAGSHMVCQTGGDAFLLGQYAAHARPRQAQSLASIAWLST